MQTKREKIIDLYYQSLPVEEISDKTKSHLEYVKTVIRELKPVTDHRIKCFTLKGLEKLKNKLYVGQQILVHDIQVDDRTHTVNHLNSIETIQALYPYIVMMESGRSYQYSKLADIMGLVETYSFDELELDTSRDNDFYSFGSNR